jgi:hypothetical protein
VTDATQSSKYQEWNTDPDFLALVRQVAPIDLDPCSNQWSLVGARHTFNEKENGLDKKWSVYVTDGLAYVNSPYGRALPKWYKKVHEEAVLYRVQTLGLCPARTDTKYFHNYLITADALCFWKGRLKFYREGKPYKGKDATSTFPPLVSYWGPQRERFAEVFGSKGKIWFPGERKVAA